MTNAHIGALGVLGAKGAISTFITSGLAGMGQPQIGGHPEGRGVLGLLLCEPRPIRVRNIRRHPNFQGFARWHPDITSFLGVPIMSKGKIIGNLYMANKCGAPEFSRE